MGRSFQDSSTDIGTRIVNPTSSPNCLVGGINNTPPQVFAQDRVDFRAALSYLPTNDITLYASACEMK